MIRKVLSIAWAHLTMVPIIVVLVATFYGLLVGKLSYDFEYLIAAEFGGTQVGQSVPDLPPLGQHLLWFGLAGFGLGVLVVLLGLLMWRLLSLCFRLRHAA